MREDLCDLVARARGMGGALLEREALEQLAGASGLQALARALPERVPAEASTADEVERALRRHLAARWALLARRGGERTVLAPLLLDEDRRSLVAVLRGVLARGGRPERALAGLVPTPSLPERALLRLVRLESHAAVAATLAAWRHPLGSALLAASRQGLAAMEQALHAEWARQASLAARYADAPLRGWVRGSIDVANAFSALVQRLHPPAGRDPGAWLPGGELLDRARYRRLLDCGPEDPRLLPALAGTVVGVALARPERGVVELDTLAEQIRRCDRLALERPLSSAPILRFALRLRAEAIDLRSVLWALALGRPSAARLLVTP